MESMYVFLEPEVQALIADNKIDLLKELRAQGLDVDGSHGGNPATTQGGKERDVVLIILAAAGAFSAVSFGIARIVDAIGRNKRTVVEEQELVPVTDGAGNVVKDAQGQPQFYWSERHRVLPVSPPPAEKSKMEVAAGGKYGIKISIAAGS